VTRGDNVTVEFLIEPLLEWNQSLQLQFTDEALEFSLISDFQSDVLSSLVIPIWHNISVGQHIVNVSPMSEYYQFSAPPQINLIVVGTMNPIISPETAYYGETLEFSLDILDDNNQAVSLVDISVFCDDVSTPFAVSGYVNSSIAQIVSLPMWISPGFHNITFIINCQYFKTANYSISVKVWMRTNITIVITTSESELNIHTSMIENPQDFLITRRISSGSIMRPPPILFNGMTSAIPLTARFTSLDN
jgi:hypothetical protein